MNFLKLSLVAASAAITIGSGTVARAFITLNVANGYYVFEAAAGQSTALNGSWVEFNNDSIINWDLVDTTSYSYLTGYPAYPSDYPPLTPTNSETFTGQVHTYDYGVDSQATGTNSFYFEIGSPATATSTSNDDVYFLGANNDSYDTTGLGDYENSASILVDPPGTWTFDLTQPGLGSVPDLSSTFELLAGALIALGACTAGMRKRAACEA
ncbi:MAG: hypothetical protein ABSA05_11325 [Opitutaceae bacterium]|jgi:hypothetical protein